MRAQAQLLTPEGKDKAKSDAGRKGAYSRKVNGNQHTKRRDLADAETYRKRIQVGMLLAKLEQAAEGKIDLSQTQVNAAKLLLDKAMPTLQAVESTVIDAAATRSEPDILRDLRALFDAHPHLVDQILADRARDVTPKPALEHDATQQSADTP